MKNMFRFIRNVYQGKCPKCKEGNTFSKEGSFLALPKMHESCSHCGYRFDREPGYFIGAMYLSYGLSVAQCVIVYVLLHLFLPDLAIGWILGLLVLTLLILAKTNYKWSRILYIYIFPW